MIHHAGVSKNGAFSDMTISIGNMTMQFSHGILRLMFVIFQQRYAQGSRIIASCPMVAVWPALRIGTWVPADWWTYPLERSTDKRSPGRDMVGPSIDRVMVDGGKATLYSQVSELHLGMCICYIIL